MGLHSIGGLAVGKSSGSRAVGEAVTATVAGAGLPTAHTRRLV